MIGYLYWDIPMRWVNVRVAIIVERLPEEKFGHNVISQACANI
jgi:hypothetical protein